MSKLQLDTMDTSNDEQGGARNVLAPLQVAAQFLLLHGEFRNKIHALAI